MNKPGDFLLSSLDKGMKSCSIGCLILIVGAIFTIIIIFASSL